MWDEMGALDEGVPLPMRKAILPNGSVSYDLGKNVNGKTVSLFLGYTSYPNCSNQKLRAQLINSLTKQILGETEFVPPSDVFTEAEDYTLTYPVNHPLNPTHKPIVIVVPNSQYNKEFAKPLVGLSYVNILFGMFHWQYVQ